MGPRDADGRLKGTMRTGKPHDLTLRGPTRPPAAEGGLRPGPEASVPGYPSQQGRAGDARDLSRRGREDPQGQRRG